MRSLLILELGHDETTDGVAELAERLYHDTGVLGVDVIDYSVRVDIPPCFVLDSVLAPTPMTDKD